ncbi:MAG: hypothetical protein GF310_03590 [candidate division Zixibacteria bacterium]|nr:hypothetical protein [candidate division Zixibacteria bacterium]
MDKRKGIIAGAILTSFILSLLIIMGCSDLPNKPESDGTFTIADFEKIASRDARLDNLEADNGVVNISPINGGTVPVAFSDGSTASLNIPANAVRTDVEISIEVTEFVFRDRAILQFDFQPDGLVFNKEAVFTIDASAFRDADIKYVDWYYYNPESGKWELAGQYRVVNGEVRILMPHFSKWMGISQGGQ